jgi:hypothetical protein
MPERVRYSVCLAIPHAIAKNCWKHPNCLVVFLFRAKRLKYLQSLDDIVAGLLSV